MPVSLQPQGTGRAGADTYKIAISTPSARSFPRRRSQRCGSTDWVPTQGMRNRTPETWAGTWSFQRYPFAFRTQTHPFSIDWPSVTTGPARCRTHGSPPRDAMAATRPAPNAGPRRSAPSSPATRARTAGSRRRARRRPCSP